MAKGTDTTAAAAAPAASTGKAPAEEKEAPKRFQIKSKDGGTMSETDSPHVAHARLSVGDEVTDTKNGNKPYGDVLAEQANPAKK